MEIDKFNFLSDQSVNTDSFDDQAHNRVAQSIIDLINSNKGQAVTIGLEGRWGSGKSTIVSILKDLVEEDKEHYQYLYIDAWAHEGDPLRRIFLEKIIQQVDPNETNPALKNIKDILSKRKKSITTKTKKAPTETASIIAILTLMVPFGASILSTINISEVSFFEFSKPIYWKFFISSLFSLSPIIFILGRFLYYWEKKGFKEATKFQNWQFISENSVDIITQEISEENEKSSIEFEKYFYDILQIILSKKNENQSKQIILVIDNLDRINAQDSLKIWSTIQTFLQYKNPNINSRDITKNLWIIVPYDENGLGKLWNNTNYSPLTGEKPDESINGKPNYWPETNSYIEECGKLQKRSFFDKCFQLRFEIPFPVQTTWVNYAKSLIDKSFIDFKQTDKSIVETILINTRESLADIPSPREIKTFINQIGIQSMLSNKKISLSCISYYVYLKYDKLITQEEIKQGLLSETIPFKNHKSILPDDAKYQLSGILFGTSSVKGRQLLLEAPILTALNNGDSKKLFALYKAHEEGFCAIYNILLDKNKNESSDNYKIDLLASANAISGKTWKESELQPNFGRLKNEIRKSIFYYPTSENYIYYQSVFELFYSDKDALQKIWENIWNSFKNNIQNQDFDADESFEVYKKIIKDFPTDSLYKITIESENLENWCKWALLFGNEDIYVIPSESNISLLCQKVVAGTPIEDKYSSLMNYYARINQYDLKQLIDNIGSYISWNNGTPNGNRITIKILDVIINIGIWGPKNNANIIIILKNRMLYNLLSYNTSYYESFALLIAIYFPKDISQFTYSDGSLGKSAPTLNSIKQIWLNSNLTNCSKLMNELEKYNQENIIWELQIKQYLQIKNIIEKAIENNDSKYFVIAEDSYNKYKEVIDILDNIENKKKFTQLIIDNNPILESILDKDVNIFFDDLEYLYWIYTNTQDIEKIKEFYQKGFINITKEQWLNILKNENLSKITIELINKNILLDKKLGAEFFKAIFEYTEKWGNGDIDPIEYISSNWKNLITNLNKSSNERIKQLSEKIFWDNIEAVTEDFITKNVKIFSPIDFDKSKQTKIYNYIEKISVKDENFSENLHKINLIMSVLKDTIFDLEINETVSFVFLKHLSTSNSEDKQKIRDIAKKMGLSEKEIKKFKETSI